jgi:DNA-binding CsgD family transcriptional regulator/pimeloyl-ACP methyl ester carboxylesterase
MSSADLPELGASLREAMQAGRPSGAIFAAWPALNDHDPVWRQVLEEITAAAGRLHPSVGMSASIHPDAVALALVDCRGQSRQASPRFLDWVGDPGASADCRRLIQKAVKGERALGLVAAADGGVLCVLAARREQTVSWRLVAREVDARPDPRDVLLVAFAPSKASTLVARAADAIGLTPLEAKLAEALLDAPNLAIAADSIGVGRATAKDALRGAMRKAGVVSAAAFVGRIVDLSCEAQGEPGADPELLGRAMGLTPAEARVTAAIAGGGDARSIAADLGLAEETVKSHRRAVFLKTGVNRSRDLRRLISEVAELDRLASASQVLADSRETQERLRVIVHEGRRVAFTDYGPASSAALVIGHGFTTGRLMPQPLLERCQWAGFRVLIPHRPGFGLTDPAIGDYLETAAGDLEAILDQLGLESVRAIARDGGVATFLDFASRRPGWLDRPILLNPRSPRGAWRPATTPMGAISRTLLDRPGMIEPFGEMIRRQTRSDLLETMLKHACAALALDRAIIEDPVVLAHLVRDAQGLMARGVRGFIDEHRAYSHGWAVPGQRPDGIWTLAYSGALFPDPDLKSWRGLPNLHTVAIEGAGLLAAYSHPDEIVALLA